MREIANQVPFQQIIISSYIEDKTVKDVTELSGPAWDGSEILGGKSLEDNMVNSLYLELLQC